MYFQSQYPIFPELLYFKKKNAFTITYKNRQTKCVLLKYIKQTYQVIYQYWLKILQFNNLKHFDFNTSLVIALLDNFQNGKLLNKEFLWFFKSFCKIENKFHLFLSFFNFFK